MNYENELRALMWFHCSFAAVALQFHCSANAIPLHLITLFMHLLYKMFNLLNWFN